MRPRKSQREAVTVDVKAPIAPRHVILVSMLLAPRYLRLVLSYTVAAVAVGWCAARGHVHVTISNPHTWVHVLQHRCGHLMLLCVAWAAIEFSLAILLPREPDFSMQLALPAR